MKTGTDFLLAARQCEIAELEQLAQTSELVAVIGQFTHALQRERGTTNVFVASRGERFAAQRRAQVEECERLERQVRARFEQFDTAAGHVRNGSRLFSRIAVVLHGLDGLGSLRAEVAALRLSPKEATATLVKLIAGLLAVVFEAADSATDPTVSRTLVALFNFMQGKEFAGQERAAGANAFASGIADAALQHHWRHLIESQQACFQAFAEFAAPTVLAAYLASQDGDEMAALERMRRVGCALPAGGQVDSGMSQAWYDCCTRRIDAMKTVEELLAVHLRASCEQRIAQARAELHDQRAMLAQLAQQASSALPEGPASYGPQLERSILAMVQDQARRLQAMSDELDTVRASLNDRKVVERAKGLLMAHRRMSEDEAYKMLRQMAMNQNRRIADVAQAVLAMASVLPAP